MNTRHIAGRTEYKKMLEKRDYYQVLAIERNASPEQVKRAYRRLALKYHPDNYKGDKSEGEAKFKELAEAYEVLSDPSKRQQYDRFGHAGLRGAGVHDFSSMGFGDIFTMFEDIFGGMGFAGRGGSPRTEGLDLETEVELSLEQVATGVDQTLEFERMDVCDTCGGNGAKPGTNPETCRTCSGYGQVHQQMASFFGTSVRVIPCPKCHGRGNIVTDPCKDCGGSGRRKKKRILTVRIPGGVHEGQVIRVRGEGEPGKASAAHGDLHVYIRIRPHPLLTRQGDDLICRVPITYTQAALGGNIEVPTLSGTETIEISPGSQNGDTLRLRQRGLPSRRSGKNGDEYVVVYIEVPKKLSATQRELLQQLAETENIDVTPERKGFFDKLKDCFSKEKTD